MKKFLDNICKFNNYSVNNQFLIWLQRPEAQYVSSFRQYKSMGYNVNKGAKGIKILIPNFLTHVKINKDDGTFEIKPLFLLNDNEKKIYKDKSNDKIIFYKQTLSGFSIGHVFDIEDTTMPKSALEELNPVINDRRADEVIGSFIKTIYKDGYRVKFDEKLTGAKGYCDHKNKEIVIKKGLGSLVELKILIHEYAHSLAHKHLENNNQDYQEHRNKYETEAESIAYTVSKYLGLPTMEYSLDYLYSWSKQKDFSEIDDSLSAIINYSNKIISNFNNFYTKELEEIKEPKI